MIDYRRILEEEAEPNYRDFTSKLIPGKEGIMGVRIPKIRALAKRIIKDDWESFLEEEPGCFEEEFLRGLVIATAPMDTERRLEYTVEFLNCIDNWSTCDSFCSSWKYPKKDSERVHSYFRSLIDSGQEYRMRVSVVFRMSHFIDDQHVEGLLSDIESYRNEGYYYKMGAAWAASFCYIAYPEKTMAVLKAGKMDDWVYRKTIQKICESYRVSDEDKAVLRSMR